MSRQRELLHQWTSSRVTIHMNRALSSCRDTTLAIWLLPSGMSDMQTTFPRLSKLIATSPPGKISRRRQDASVCNSHISQVRTTKLNRGVSILRTRIEMILEVNFPVKIPATCYSTTNKMNGFNQKELIVQSSKGVH
jgi:hypothetical protein